MAPRLIEVQIPDRLRWWWTRPQRRSFSLAIILVAAGFLLLLFARPAVIPDPQPLVPARFDDLRDRIDPNTATAAELAVLPNIGPARAQAICDYRDSVPAPAFRTWSDLTRVHGIGPVIARQMAPHLVFEAPGPAEPPHRPQP